MAPKGRIPSTLPPKCISQPSSPLRPSGFCTSQFCHLWCASAAPIILTGLLPFSHTLHTTSQHSRNKDVRCVLPSLSQHCLQIKVNPSWSWTTCVTSFPQPPPFSHPSSNLLPQHPWPPAFLQAPTLYPHAAPPTGNTCPSSSSFKARVTTPLPGLPDTLPPPSPFTGSFFLCVAHKPCA